MAFTSAYQQERRTAYVSTLLYLVGLGGSSALLPSGAVDSGKEHLGLSPRWTLLFGDKTFNPLSTLFLAGRSLRWDSNPQPADYKSAALPVELQRHNSVPCRNRTIISCRADLNRQPVDYKTTALPIEPRQQARAGSKSRTCVGFLSAYNADALAATLPGMRLLVFPSRHDRYARRPHFL